MLNQKTTVSWQEEATKSNWLRKIPFGPFELLIPQSTFDECVQLMTKMELGLYQSIKISLFISADDPAAVVFERLEKRRKLK